MKPVPVPTVGQIRLGGHSEWPDGKHCLLGEVDRLRDMAAESLAERRDLWNAFDDIYQHSPEAKRLILATCPNTLANRRAAVRILRAWLERCGFRETECPEPPTAAGASERAPSPSAAAATSPPGARPGGSADAP